MAEKIKCLIIGSGPAGYTAGIYASRAGLEPILMAGIQPGGQLTITSEVENFPGYPKGESGFQIMEDIRQQCVHAGTKIENGIVSKIDLSKRPFLCTIDDGREFLADTVIMATGATARWLGLESENQYKGYGVSTCATCDGAFFVGKEVAVIGGGDTALEEALYLAHRCSKVYLIHRRDAFRACKAYQDKVFAAPNIEVVWDSVPTEIMGEQKGFMRQVTGIKLSNVKDKSENIIPLEGVFVAIGVHPVTELVQGQLELDESGYIKTQPGTPFTSVPGVFAAGDVQDPIYRQAVTAAASGCKAGVEAEKFLSLNS